MFQQLFQMKKSLGLALLALAAGMASLSNAAPDPGPGIGGASASPRCLESGTSIVFDTTPVCNCTGEAGTIEICHSTSVELTIGGGSIGSFSTGKSESECFSQRKDHGECLYWRYVFDCCEGFWGYSCSLTSSQAKSTTSDCDV